VGVSPFGDPAPALRRAPLEADQNASTAPTRNFGRGVLRNLSDGSQRWAPRMTAATMISFARAL
jgi:hypothetical protein